MEPLSHIYAEKLSNGYTFEMRLIPGGAFDMGSTDANEDAYNNEKPQRIGVQVAPFYLAPHAVTQAIWKSVMGENRNPSRFKGDQRPVENITWYDTQVFIKSLNTQTTTNRNKFDLGEYRLPTEAEWEYAAKGGPLNAGYRYAGSDKLKEVGWYEANSDNETHEVGLLMPNHLGLFDMSGNIWEWVEDHWQGNYKDAPKDCRARVIDDYGASRVLRGGGYFDVSQFCRIAYRSHLAPDYHLGFRLALSSILQDRQIGAT